MLAWAGSVGRIVCPLLTNAASNGTVFALSAGLSAVCGVCLCVYACSSFASDQPTPDSGAGEKTALLKANNVELVTCVIETGQSKG
jgi:hypothetical protein